MSWLSENLGELVSTKKGYAFKSKWYQDTGHPIVKVSDFTDDSINAGSLVKIPNNIAQQYCDYELHEGDIVIQTVGSWPSNPASVVGKCVRVPNAAHKTLLNQNAVKLVPKTGVDNDFLYYTLKSPRFKSYIIGRARGSASQASITLDAIREFEVTLPSIDVQKHIASILKSYDDLIENNRRRIQLLEETARLLYKEWFVQLRFPGHEHVKTIDGVPEGWTKKNLGELCIQIKKTVSPSEVEEGTNYIGLEHIPRRSITLSKWETAEKVTSTKYAYKEGDFIFGKIRPYFHKVGFTLADGITSSDAIVIRPSEPEYYAYLLMLISSDQFVGLASKTVKEGSKMPRADWPFLLKQNFLVPNTSLVELFGEYVSDVLKQLKLLALQNKQLSQARDLLLPRLMNGELSV